MCALLKEKGRKENRKSSWFYLVLSGAAVNRFERGRKGFQDDIWIQQLLLFRKFSWFYLVLSGATVNRFEGGRRGSKTIYG